MNRDDFQRLAETRLEDAKALLKAGRFDAAYYLGGYAVECALKVCIAKATRRGEFPDKKKVDSSYTDNLRELMKVARLDEARGLHAGRDAAFREQLGLGTVMVRAEPISKTQT